METRYRQAELRASRAMCIALHEYDVSIEHMVAATLHVWWNRSGVANEDLRRSCYSTLPRSDHVFSCASAGHLRHDVGSLSHLLWHARPRASWSCVTRTNSLASLAPQIGQERTASRDPSGLAASTGAIPGSSDAPAHTNYVKFCPSMGHPSSPQSSTCA